MVLRRVFLKDYGLILPLLTLTGKDHLEGRDPEMLVPLVLLSQDLRLSPKLPKDIIFQPMHSIRHLLPLDLWPRHIYIRHRN